MILLSYDIHRMNEHRTLAVIDHAIVSLRAVERFNINSEHLPTFMEGNKVSSRISGCEDARGQARKTKRSCKIRTTLILGTSGTKIQ